MYSRVFSSAVDIEEAPGSPEMHVKSLRIPSGEAYRSSQAPENWSGEYKNSLRGMRPPT